MTVVNNKPDYRYRQVNVGVKSHILDNEKISFYNHDTMPSKEHWDNIINALPKSLKAFSTPNHQSGYYINQQGTVTVYGDYVYFNGKRLKNGEIIQHEALFNSNVRYSNNPWVPLNGYFTAYCPNPYIYPNVKETTLGYVLECKGLDIYTCLLNDPFIKLDSSITKDCTPEDFITEYQSDFIINKGFYLLSGDRIHATGYGYEYIPYRFPGVQGALKGVGLFMVDENKSILQVTLSSNRFCFYIESGKFTISKENMTITRMGEAKIHVNTSRGWFHDINNELFPLNQPVPWSRLCEPKEKNDTITTGDESRTVGYTLLGRESTISYIGDVGTWDPINPYLPKSVGDLKGTKLNLVDNIMEDIIIDIIPDEETNYFNHNLSRDVDEWSIDYNQYKKVNKRDPDIRQRFYDLIIIDWVSGNPILDNVNIYENRITYKDNRFLVTTSYDLPSTIDYWRANALGDRLDAVRCSNANGSITMYGVNLELKYRDIYYDDSVYPNLLRSDKDENDRITYANGWLEHYRYIINDETKLDWFSPFICVNGGMLKRGKVTGDVLGFDVARNRYYYILEGTDMPVHDWNGIPTYTSVGSVEDTNKQCYLTAGEILALQRYTIPLKVTYNGDFVDYSCERTRLGIKPINSNTKITTSIYLFKEPITGICYQGDTSPITLVKNNDNNQLSIKLSGEVTLSSFGKAVTVKPKNDYLSLYAFSIIDEIKKGNLLVVDKVYTDKHRVDDDNTNTRYPHPFYKLPITS